MIELYRFASPGRPSGGAGKIPGGPLLAIFLIGALATLSGGAAGIGIKALTAPQPSVLKVKVQRPQPVEAAVPVEVAVAAPQPAATDPAPNPTAAPPPAPVRPAVAPRPAVRAPAALTPVPAPVVAPPAPLCAANQQMDDVKINWLLDQSAKTLAENPSQAAGAARVNSDLRSALGKNLCASQAQALVANTCTDPAAVKFLNTMVNRLPFFIKPMVGNPCTANLVAVLNKMGSYIS